MRFLIAHPPIKKRSADPFVHAVGSMGWKSLCGVAVESYEENVFTHLHARACPKCVKIVQSEGGLK